MIHGKNTLGKEISGEGSVTFKAFNPATLQELPGVFHSATTQEVDKAATKAKEAYAAYKRVSGKQKAVFLKAIADNLEQLGATLIDRVVEESGLTEARLIGERGRTVNQLRMFAGLLEEGSWCDAVIDTALPERKPLPRPDIRKMLRPIGPVAVFSASNFPLAFSVAGGDTASALAAGCPVIVKAHSFHPGTSEMVAGAITKAAQDTGMPDGVFSMIHSIDHAVSQSLVTHPYVKAAGFTGSFYGGKMLYDLAQKREEPIPFFAEMGSVNPVICLPGKVSLDASELGAQLAGSITLGAGQFCTNPGIIVAMEGEKTKELIAALTEKIKMSLPETMLNPRIREAYQQKTSEMEDHPAVEIVSQTNYPVSDHQGRSLVAKVSSKEFLAHPKLAEEIFGPFSLVIECKDEADFSAVIQSFKGQLTATIMGTENDVTTFREQITALQEVVGRLIFNGLPTGVEVGYAMQHGGPFPATTDARFTSVGMDAIKRFVRPVAIQNAPQSYLPDELKDENPLSIWRTVNASFSKESI